MNTTLIAAALSGALMVPTAAQSAGGKKGVSSVVVVAPETAEFVKSAAAGDTFELLSSRIAQERGGSDVKQFAARMIRDHTETTSELKMLVADRRVKAKQHTSGRCIR